MEICGLKIKELPDKKTAQNALKEERTVDVKLSVTKGSKPALIKAHPLLVIRTWNWIECERTACTKILRKKTKKLYAQYSEPEEIFLSLKTGLALLPRSLSNQVRNAFLTAVAIGELSESERVWLHGLRRFMATNELKLRDKAGQVRPEEIVRHQTRHSSLDALSPYIQDRYDEVIRKK